jgi:uncharacterized protein YggE
VSETTITVQGRHAVHHAAERATIAVSVHHESPDRRTAFEGTVRSAASVRGIVTALAEHPAAPVTAWSSDTVQVWGEKPWNSEGVQLPPVFHARIAFSVTFGDFAALARFVEDVAAVPATSVDSILWALTDARLAIVTDEVRSLAVQDAVAKAGVYARSIGLGRVTAEAVADPGMLGGQTQAASTESVHYSRSYKSAIDEGAPALSLTPEKIEVAATVDARFLAS